ncbi:MAG: (d)CMP kinase [Candidatus Aadella gelida]|nr:(d)CMP kinase [Candidatus Aadella gelida]
MFEEMGEELSSNLRIEVAIILAIIQRLENTPFHDINADIDKWYSTLNGRERLTDILPTESYKEKDMTVVNLSILRGPYKGRKVKVISSCKNLADIQADESKIRIGFVEDEGESRNKAYTKTVPMEIGKARQSSTAEIIFTGGMKDRAEREKFIEEVIRAYEKDTPDYIVDYADGIDRSKDEMIIIRELNGAVLGFISYGETEEGQYMSYFQYVFRLARGRNIGRNLIGELVKELSKDALLKKGQSFLTTTPLTYDGENLWTTLFGESVIKKERRPGRGEVIRRGYVDLGEKHSLNVEPLLAKQPILNDSFIATIDGPSGTGKSTASSESAKRLGAVHFSYGKIYRLITWFAMKNEIALNNKIDPETVDRLCSMAKEIEMTSFEAMEKNGFTQYLYSGEDITDLFYSESISSNVSFVSAIPEIRRIAARKVRDMINNLRKTGVSFILEGRVTGVEIAPYADIKIYLNADLNERAERRARQMIKKDGFEETCRQEFGLSEDECRLLMEDSEEEALFKKLVQKVAESITERDTLDTRREHMPAIEPKNAVIVNSTGETLETTVLNIVNLIEVARIRGLVERNITLDEDAVKRLHVFYDKYVSLVKELFDYKGIWFRDDEYINTCLAPEKIADMFYLSEVYQFDVFELLGKNGRTRWVKDEGHKKTEYEFTLNAEKTVSMLIPTQEGLEPEEIAKAKRNSYGVKDREKYKGRNIGHFTIKTQFLTLWAKEKTKKEDIGIALNIGQNKLIKLYKNWGAKTYMDIDGDMRAAFDLYGGLDASILTAEQAEKMKTLDSRIWHRWSQRSIDRYLSMVNNIEPSLLEKAHTAFSEEQKRATTDDLNYITPGTVANFILLKTNFKKDGHPAQKKQKGFYPIKAEDSLCILRDEVEQEVAKAVKERACSISVDPKTGEKIYLKQGDPFIRIDTDVYMMGDKSWDIPAGVEFPESLKDVINGKDGAMVIVAGPFYIKKEGSRYDRNIRPLTDEEVYERFGLRRVYEKEDKPFTMPVLGIAGRSVLLPVPYTIATAQTGEGTKIVRDSKDLGDRSLKIHHVFGLEFKNIGTPAYKKHNINPAFPPTVFEEYLDKPGVFLDWWHQLGTRYPVGMGKDYGTTLPRETSALGKGSKLTRWTLANLRLEEDYAFTLRTPVNDYRRLSVFFDKSGKPLPERFHAIVEELGLTLEEYLLRLSGSYGENLRKNIEIGIMEGSHGSIIDSDIFGHETDLGDFWEINEENKKFLKDAVHAWIDNLVKVLNIAGPENKHIQDKALEVFAEKFFGEKEKIKINVNDTEKLKTVATEHAFDILLSPPVPRKKIDGTISEKKKEATDLIDRVNDKSLQVFSGVRNHLLKMLEKDKGREDLPLVDIVIDLSLISKNDMENNASTWAHLVLLCGKLENVNFVFKKRAASHNMSEGLIRDIADSPSEDDMLAMIKKKLYDNSDFFKNGMNAEKLFKKCVNVDKREDAIEIPIMHGSWLDWARNNGINIKDNQYPVAMSGFTATEANGVALRNFEAALTIGLSKAVLVMAKKRGKGVQALEDEEIRKLLEDTCMLSKLQALYKTVFDGKILITENTLRNMIYPNASVRMNLAISLALPEITRMTIDKLHDLHDTIKSLLRAA